jgi:hypothetical protein
MRCAFLLWPIGQEGGLATQAHAMVEVCRRNDIEANFYRLAYTDKNHGMGSSDLSYGINESAGLRLQGRCLSITDAKLPETLRHLDSYDQLIFVHPCPHLADKASAVKNWRRLFTDTQASKSVFFSDVYADDYYPWIEEVAHLFRALAFNDGIANYVRETLELDSEVVPHPWLNVPAPRLDDARERLVLWTAAWRGWKGIKRFCEAVPAIEGHVRLYGTGRELRQFRKIMPPQWPGEIMGVCDPALVLIDYARAACSVDLTGQSPKYHGHYNRTTTEPMLYGAVSVTLPTLVQPYSRVPAECVWTVEKDSVAEGINELLTHPERALGIRESAYEWLRDTCQDSAVLDSLLRAEVTA